LFPISISQELIKIIVSVAIVISLPFAFALVSFYLEVKFLYEKRDKLIPLTALTFSILTILIYIGLIIFLFKQYM